MAARALIGLVILHSVTGTHGVLDFTCFSSNPRIDRNGDNDMFIGGYRSGDDTDASVSFQRAIDTGTGSGLPRDSSERDRTRPSARILDMPQSGGTQRIGAFNCVAEKDGVTERIATTIMASNSEIIPQQVSQTVSVGESVHFVMERSTSQHVWRQHGLNPEIQSWHGLTQVTIDGVSADDAGVYECHKLHRRHLGIHAIFQLLVRTCEDGKWGTSCQGECPKCLNGGICDDRSGKCVCAPGFSGTNCRTVHGRNRFGQDGEIRCSGSDPHGDGCQGKLFCLPHPYGCSCAAGFKGIDCNDECEDSHYGANCRQECHCASGVSCLKDTGECDGGPCDPNWYGVNCQERCSEPVPRIVTGLHATPQSNSLRVEWDANPNPCSADIEYVVTYELTNLDKCQEQNVNIQEAGVVRATQIIILNLFYYSDYIIRVKARHNGIREGEWTSISQTTEQAAPAVSPVITNQASTPNALIFSWNEVPCGFRRGAALRYSYTLRKGEENLISETKDITTITFYNLTECTHYQFQVQAVNNIGSGPDSLLHSVLTPTIEPGPVNALRKSLTPSPYELLLSWRESTQNNCHEDMYIIRYALVNKDQCQMVADTSVWENYRATSELTILLTDLMFPFSTYNISIAARNSAGEGKKVFITQTTNQSEPSSPPTNVTTVNITSSAITFEWSAPSCGNRHGQIVSYSCFLTNVNNTQNISDSTPYMEITISNLTPFTQYFFQVAAVTEVGIGPRADNLLTFTKEAVPSAPASIEVSEVTRTSMKVTWQEPLSPNGIITNYSIESKVIEKPYDPMFNQVSELKEVKNGVGQRSCTLRNLKPSTKYEITVFAHSGAGRGDAAVVEKYTHPATEDDLTTPDELEVIDDSQITSSTVLITIPRSSSVFVTSYQIAVELKTTKRDVPMFGIYSESPDSYVAAEVGKDYGPKFMVGDNNTYGMYYNPLLKGGQTYTLYTAFVSRINQTTYGVSWSNGIDVTLPTGKAMFPVWVPILCIIIVIAIFGAAIAVIILRRTNRKDAQKEATDNFVFSQQTNKEGTTNIDETTGQDGASENNAYVDLEQPGLPPLPSPPLNQSHKLATDIGPIKVDDFEAYVQAKKDSQDNSFNLDFKALPGDNLHSRVVAKKGENKKKNRYANITTYDHSRVLLSPLEGDPHSDYINASFIDGVYEQKKYIASQGPNTSSVEDFWRMIWQYKVKKIVMLTNLVENGKIKCEKYWPDKKDTKGGVDILPRREMEFVDYVLRIFHIQQVASGETRELRQYHFISWPDMGVPKCPSLLSFMRIVNDYQPQEAGPTLIHCSAGVGRTGTYMTIDAMMDQAKREGTVDVHGFISKMRNSRMKMVQIVAQYQFIFATLVEAFVCGETAIQKKDFQSDFKKLAKIDSKSGSSGLKRQFEALEKVTTWPNKERCGAGNNPINSSRNRFPDIIPTESSRPYLMTDVGKNNNDYINAAYIDSTRANIQHIVTQMPLPNTVADIWRLIYDHNFYAIVMLNTLNYKDPSMAKYWPNKGDTTTFGPLTLKCIEEDVSLQDIIVRKFLLSNAYNQNEGEKTIRQFELQNWLADDDEPSSAESVLALIRCLKQRNHQESCQRMVIHCIDGVGASCTFLAIMSVLEQLEDDHNVDVFQAVRRLRLTRPQAVRNLAQYTFCYKAIETHLNSSNIYENYTQPQENGQQNSSLTEMQDGEIYANIQNGQQHSAATTLQDKSIYANV